MSSLAWRIRVRFLLGRFDRYLAVGSRAREFLTYFDVRDSAIHDSPHAVDNAFFATQARPFQESQARAEARAELDITDDAFVVLFVGKIERRRDSRIWYAPLPR